MHVPGCSGGAQCQAVAGCERAGKRPASEYPTITNQRCGCGVGIKVQYNSITNQGNRLKRERKRRPGAPGVQRMCSAHYHFWYSSAYLICTDPIRLRRCRFCRIFQGSVPNPGRGTRGCARWGPVLYHGWRPVMIGILVTFMPL